MPDHRGRVAILYPGTLETRRAATPRNNRFADVFTALAERGLDAEPAVYHDDFRDEVRAQLAHVDVVLVWINPIEGGRDRTMLDGMLREVGAGGVLVSAHPDIVLKLGTKDVLVQTRDVGWGCETHQYGGMQQLRDELPPRLAAGKARVLKRQRGNGGEGVWKVQLPPGAAPTDGSDYARPPQPETVVRVHHAKRGCIEEEITLDQFFDRCAPYFAAGGGMIDQEYQERLPEGMIRCYLVHDKVGGFGVQAINALVPAPAGAPRDSAPQPGPRLYHPATLPQGQRLKQKLEEEWVPAAQRLLGIETEQLPVLWDCDFLLGARDGEGEDTYVLCEINCSSVAPYPPSAVPALCDATVAMVHRSQRRRARA